MKDKIPFYNIVNMFFVGAVFTIAVVLLLHEKINIKPQYMAFAHDWNILVSALLIIIMYEVGFIINRAGSVIIDPLLVKTEIWPRYKYGVDVSDISASNPKFQSMITELNLMRSHILIYIILLAISIVLKRYGFALLFVALIIIFILGGRKHNKKINTIREYHSKHYV